MKILDAGKVMPHMINGSLAYVWEVVVSEWEGEFDDYNEIIKAVFFDPWNAVQYATAHFGACCMVQLSSRQIAP